MASGHPAGASTTVRHPLDPLSADEIRATVAILRREHAAGDGWRFAMIELHEPSKAALAGDAPVERAATVLCWNRADGQAYKAVVSLTGDRVETWEHRPGEQPNMTVDEFHEVNEALRRDPRIVEALARRGVTDMERVLFDTWALRRVAHPFGVRRPPRRLVRRLGPGRRRRREPLRQPDHRAAPDRRPQRDDAARARGHRRRRAGGHDGRVHPAPRPRPAPARRHHADRDHAARGRLVRPRRQPPHVAALVAADRVQPPRGHGPPHGRLRGRRPRAADRAPAVVRRDGRPLPRPDGRARAAHGVRHRRVGPRLHDDLARARLRLPRRDPPTSTPSSTTRTASRRRSATRSASTRRTAPCCGSTSTSTRGPRRGGCAASSSPSTRRSPTTSTSSTGASTRTGASSARSARPGSW